MIQRTFRLKAQLIYFSLILLGCSVVVKAQDSQMPDRGFHPSGSYAVSNFETINTTNGNVMLNIPLGSLPSGRGGLSASLNLLYNSKLYNSATTYSNCPEVPAGPGLLPKTPPYPSCGGDPGEPKELLGFDEDAGWRYVYNYRLRPIYSGYEGYDAAYCNSPQHQLLVSLVKMQVIFPDGSAHDFRLTGYAEPDQGQPNYFPINPDGSATANSSCQGYSSTTNNLVYYSIDGTYARLEIEHSTQNWTLKLPDGTRVTSATSTQGQRIYDRNNNYIEIIDTGFTYNSNPAVKIVDQLERKIIVEKNSSTNEDLIHVWGVDNQEIVWTVKWKTIAVNKSYNSGPTLGVIPITPMQKNRRVVDQIILPALTGESPLNYTFGYNAGTDNPSIGWGEISSITTPSGAQVTYTWAMDGITGGQAYPQKVVENTLTQKTLSYLAEYDGTSTQVTEQWSYSINQEAGVTQITGPDGGVMTQYFDPGTDRVYKTQTPDGSVIENLRAYNTPYGYPSYAAAFTNTFVKTEYRSIRDAAGNLSKTAITEYQQDKNGNTTKVTSYDWVDWSSVARNGSGNPTGVIPTGATIKRVVVNSYYNSTADSSDTTTNDANAYSASSAPSFLRALSSSEVKFGVATDGSQTTSRTEYFYDNAGTTANLTQQKSWDSTKAGYSNPLSSTNSISVATQYNQYGSPVLVTDARGTQTQITYGTVGTVSDLYPTQNQDCVWNFDSAHRKPRV